MAPFLQSNIRHINIRDGVLYPDFFVAVKDHCPNLESMRLAAPYQDVHSQGMTLLNSTFLDFIHHYPHLTIFSAQKNLYNHLDSASALQAIASCHNLQTVDLPPLTVDLIPVIKALDSKSFSRVQNLGVTAEEPCLEHLSVFFNEIEIFNLTVLGKSDTVLCSCTKFDLISDVRIKFDQNDSATIKGSDLLFLAKHCPGLAALDISEESADPLPKAIDITDETIEALAEARPELLALTLFFAGTTLTEKSIISLGAICPEISHIQIPADISFERLVDAMEWMEFREMDSLCLSQGRWQDSEVDLHELAHEVLEIAPQLRVFQYGPSEEFTKAVQDKLWARLEFRRERRLERPGSFSPGCEDESDYDSDI